MKQCLNTMQPWPRWMAKKSAAGNSLTGSGCAASCTWKITSTCTTWPSTLHPIKACIRISPASSKATAPRWQIQNSSGKASWNKWLKNALSLREAQKRGIQVSEQEINLFLQGPVWFLSQWNPNPKPDRGYIWHSHHFTRTGSPLKIYPDPKTGTHAKSATATPKEVTPAPTSTPTAAPVNPTPQTTCCSNRSSHCRQPEPTATVYTKDLYDNNLKEYYATLQAAKVPEASLRDYVRKYLLRLKLQESYNQNPEKSEQVWARHILVKTEADAKIVLSRLANKEEWAKIAADVSIDTGTKDNGGDLGWFGKGRMVAPFEIAAFALKESETSAPVQSDFGWHIIQLVGKANLPMAFENWITQVKANYKIEMLSWENMVPTEPTIPPELIIPTQVPN